jgi:hypothetical protein
MDKSRSIDEVLERILLFIPNEELVLRNDLVEFKNSLWNQAPEARRAANNWIPVQHILMKHITNINTEWQTQVANIFNDTE